MKPLKRRFSDIKASPESAWIADVAILTTTNGPLHCALVQDLKTERVLGWATALDADPTLMTRAIEVACERHTKTHPTNLFLYQISEYRSRCSGVFAVPGVSASVHQYSRLQPDLIDGSCLEGTSTSFQSVAVKARPVSRRFG